MSTRIARGEWPKHFLIALGKGLTIKDAAASVGITRDAVYQRRYRHPDFAEEMDRVRSRIADEVSDILLSAARDGDARAAWWLLRHIRPHGRDMDRPRRRNAVEDALSADTPTT